MTAASDPALVEAKVREYYNAHGWADELWAMGFAEACQFATHFTLAGRALGLEQAAQWHDDRAGGLLAILANPQSIIDAGPVDVRQKSHVESAHAIRALAKETE